VNETLRLSLRLLVAAVLGGLLGYERQRRGKTAGLRTHMLVALGSATLIVANIGSGGSKDDVARVIQGAAAGIGFMGAGAILKETAEERVRGLTTAASVWMAAGLGMAAAMGSLTIAVIAAILAWIILDVIARIESRI
jgi:putative Mg2+ transporter-C (MgtC) family protein